MCVCAFPPPPVGVMPGPFGPIDTELSLRMRAGIPVARIHVGDENCV